MVREHIKFPSDIAAVWSNKAPGACLCAKDLVLALKPLRGGRNIRQRMDSELLSCAHKGDIRTRDSFCLPFALHSICS